jgi:hypothetical protein
MGLDAVRDLPEISACAALTLRLVQTPHLVPAPRWLAPYLLPALLALDTVVAVGVVAIGITILSMRSE